MEESIQRVAIAVVEHEGTYLVGTRRPDEVLGGHAEFPGGKCLPHEESSAGAVRECREETGLDVIAVYRIYACQHTYAYGTLDLEFWLCQPTHPERAAMIAANYRWVPTQALQSLPFPDANQPVLELLAAEPPSAS